MTMYEFETLLQRIDAVHEKVDALGLAFGRHCAAEEAAAAMALALSNRRMRWVSMLSTAAAVVSSFAALAAYLSH
jgi:hypothetical protein